MVVDDLDVSRLPTRPAEANPPLIVYPNTVLARAFSFEALQSISRRDSQIFNSLRCVQKEKPAKSLTLNVLAPFCNSNSIEYTGCLWVRERLDRDGERTPDYVINANRYYVSPRDNLPHQPGRLTSCPRTDVPLGDNL